MRGAPGRRRSTYYGATLLWAHRVDVALDVDGDVAVVGLLEDADDVEDGVRRRDVREEGVAWLGVGVRGRGRVGVGVGIGVGVGVRVFGFGFGFGLGSG